MKKNPKHVEIVRDGATYMVPTYYINQDGVNSGPDFQFMFCKGNKNNMGDFRQAGFFTESIIQVAKMYLESVNSGDLENRETTKTIEKLDEALMWLNKRAEDRITRQVQNTYIK